MKLNEEQKELLSLIQDEEYLKGLTLTKPQLLVYAALFYRDGGYTQMKELTDGFFTQSNEQLMSLTGIGSKTTLTAALRRLENVGIIERVPGTINGRIATAYKLKKSTDNEKCTDKKCTDTDLHNLLKDIKLNKKCTDTPIQKCTDEKQKCTIDIEIEKEEDKEKENRDIMENLEVKQTEVKETELVKALKRIEVLEEKINYYEINQKTLFQTVGELVERFNTILKNPFFNNIPATAGNNLPSNGSERKSEGNESSNESGKNEPSTEKNNAPQGLTPSTGRFSKQEAEELEKSFNFFIKNLRSYSPEEQKKLMEHFTAKAKETYTGNFIEKKLQWMEASFQGMYKTINGKTPKNNASQTSKEEKPSKPTTQPTAQPANNGLSEYDIFNEIANTFSRDHYSPATAKQARERIQNLIFNGNLATNQKKNLLEHLLRVINDRFNEYKKEIEAKNSQLTTQADNDTTNVTKSENEPKNALPDEADKNEGTNTGAVESFGSSEYFRLAYEANNNLHNKSEVNDFLMNNKLKIEALTELERKRILDVCAGVVRNDVKSN